MLWTLSGTTPDTMEVTVGFAVLQLDLCRDCNEDTTYLFLYYCFFKK